MSWVTFDITFYIDEPLRARILSSDDGRLRGKYRRVIEESVNSFMPKAESLTGNIPRYKVKYDQRHMLHVQLSIDLLDKIDGLIDYENWFSRAEVIRDILNYELKSRA